MIVANSAVRELRNYIGGEWRDAADGATREIINPATGEVIATAPSSTTEDVEHAVEAAIAAYEEWQDSTPRECSELVHAIADVAAEHAEELVALDLANAGKPRSFAHFEVEWAIDDARCSAGLARSLEGRSVDEYVRGYTSMVRREPIGTVAHIEPWNYPFLTAFSKAAVPLATGNAVILKPSELTPLSTLRLAELTHGVIPDGLFNVVCGEGVPVGQTLAEHPKIALISLTGEPQTATAITRASAPTMKRLHFELGGNAPVIVFDDADIDLAVSSIRLGGYWNAGQDCGAACRVLAGPGVHDRLLEELVPAVESIRVGDPATSEDIEMGPLISKEHQERVLGFVDRAASAGARVVSGGQVAASQGFFVEPTLITQVEQRSEIAQKEVFGPVVTLQTFADEAEALSWANDSNTGLSASVFTQSHARAMRFARSLRYGTVWINDHARIATEMPWGGFRRSGTGKAHSVYALEEYTQIKHVMSRIE